MTQNFAAQPENGGGMVILTANDLIAGITKKPNGFVWVSTFNDNLWKRFV